MNCPLCEQKMDLYTKAHKNMPFVDNKFYDRLCFTCYSAPKILEQKYKEDGSIEEEIKLPYSSENLHTEEELFYMGASDTRKYAKKCLEAIRASCSKLKKDKKPKNRPSASWNMP